MAHYWNNWVALDDWVIWHHVRIHDIGSWGMTVNCDAPESHIDYREESEWVYM